MTGDALTNYADFAQGSRDALDQLSGVESDLGQRLQEAADAVSAAKTASQSALDVVSSASDALDQVPESPAAELAVLHALRAQVGHELELHPHPPGDRRPAGRATPRAGLLSHAGIGP